MNKNLTALPKVAIVGRPNVGKSSLFNRIIRQRKAIVYSEAGTTRDRVAQEVIAKGKRFILIDTGGWLSSGQDRMFKMVKAQIKKAIEDADFLLFVCDAKEGLLPQDEELAVMLRRSNKRIFLAVNKSDNEKLAQTALDFYQFGLGKPYPVSALHNTGMDELLNDLAGEFHSLESEWEKQGQGVKVAIVGRPNVGKSSFVNYLLKEERVIVDERPGTTRDTIDTYLKYDGGEFILIDTAGLRHKKKVKEPIDVYSMMRAREVIKRSDACVFLIDGYEGLATDDLKVLDMILREGRCCILCVNKWDLVTGPTQPEYKEMIYKRANFLKRYPVFFASAKTGYNVYKSLGIVKEAVKNSSLKISTTMLNRLLNHIKLGGPFASRKNKLKVYYITQTRTNPPTFLIFADNPSAASEVHKNFIENIIRKNFDLTGTPITLVFRKKTAREA